jgi:hypothetical protein
MFVLFYDDFGMRRPIDRGFCQFLSRYFLTWFQDYRFVSQIDALHSRCWFSSNWMASNRLDMVELVIVGVVVG